MESKGMVHDSYNGLRVKPVSLDFDRQLILDGGLDHFDSESPSSYPSSVAHSPISPFIPRSSSVSTADSKESDASQEVKPEPQTAALSSSLNAKIEKEKRKRSRVTPDQLVHLERFFSVDRSPTAARRREISELLGMQERQTQIWFQNRRAKAKLQDGKMKCRGPPIETPPDSPPELSTGFEFDLHNLIHEEEPITIIPCANLSIGNWRRIATSVGKHDLVAYISEAKRCLTWFIHSAGYGFKMEIPFDIIVDAEFSNETPGNGLASFVLSQPPVFYLEAISSPGPNGSVTRHWKRCADWTEGQQATKVMRHELRGSAVQLAHILRNLKLSRPSSDIRLVSPSYNASSVGPLELPQPPLAGLPGFPYTNDSRDLSRIGPLMQSGRRTFSGSPMVSHPHGDPRSASAGPDGHTLSAAYPTYLCPPRGQLTRSVSSYNTPSTLYSDFVGMDPSQTSPAVSPGLSPTQSYSTVSLSPQYYSDESRLTSPYPTDRRDSASTTFSHNSLQSPSPPLLTTPFHPQTAQDSTVPELSPENVETCGLPGLSYESEGDCRGLEIS